MNHASLFSGIGGFDLAAEWAGWTNVFNCEIDPFCQKVLKYHFPDALQFGDIKKLKFKRDDRGQLWVRRNGLIAYTKCSTKGQNGNSDTTCGEWGRVIQEEDERRQSEAFQYKGCSNLPQNKEEETYLPIPSIDIVSGGFPCQPFSMAGKRRGTEDDRHLWPSMLRAIQEIKPTWIVGENVYGFTNWSGGLVFREVLSDLENEGYEVQPYIIPACAVNAPHRRDRVWIVAHRSSKSNILQSNCGIDGKTNKFEGKETREFNGENSDGYFTNSIKTGLEGGDESGCKERGMWKHLRGHSTGCNCQNGDAADTEPTGLERGIGTREPIRFNEGNNEAITDTDSTGGQRERKLSKSGREKRISNYIPGWDNFPTQSPLRVRNDGIPAGLDGITVSKLRNESIKAAGNAIVSQVAFEFFKAINKYNLKTF